MHRKELARFAKFLWYVLAVRPDEFGLVPDLEGFVENKLLLQALREEPEWSFLNLGHLAELIHSPEGARFEFQADRLRAKDPMISMVPEATGYPPRRLFHAVRRRAHPVVLQHGLRPSKGPWVVMAATAEMALRIGKRRDPDPVILEVKAEEALGRGVRFHATQGILFLAQFVPPEYLAGPPAAPLNKEESRRRAKEALVAEPPGSFFLDPGNGLSRSKPGGHREKERSWRRRRRRGRE